MPERTRSGPWPYDLGLEPEFDHAPPDTRRTLACARVFSHDEKKALERQKQVLHMSCARQGLIFEILFSGSWLGENAGKAPFHRKRPVFHRLPCGGQMVCQHLRGYLYTRSPSRCRKPRRCGRGSWPVRISTGEKMEGSKAHTVLCRKAGGETSLREAGNQR